MKTNTSYLSVNRDSLERALYLAILNDDTEARDAADRLLSLFDGDDTLQSVVIPAGSLELAPGI